MTNTTNAKNPTRPDDAKQKQLDRRKTLSAIEKQAECDARVGLAWLRGQIDHYRTLDPSSEEAADAAIDLDCETCFWDADAWVDTPTCRLALSYEDVEDITAYRLEELTPAGAEVVYPGRVIVSLGKIQNELEELLIAAQGITTTVDS